MSLLDWFKKVYQPEEGSQTRTPYFHMPEDRPKNNERHNLQQDLIDAIRSVGKGYDPVMIDALISYIERHSGIKTFAESIDPFLKKVFDKRIFDIRNILEGFFWEKGYLDEIEADNFIKEVTDDIQKTWIDKEFKEIEIVKAVGPDGKEKEFEKGNVPEGYKVVEEAPKPTIAPSPEPIPTPVPQTVQEVPVVPQVSAPVEVPLKELPPEASKPIQKEVGQQPAKKRKQRLIREYW